MIYTYRRYTKVITNNWDIRLLVTIKFCWLLSDWTARYIYMIELMLESFYQIVSDNI